MKQICLFLIFLIAYPGQSQIRKFKNLSVNEGLSHSDVRSIAADDKGFIWLATNSGLNRFDGYELSTFKQKVGDALSLPNNRIAKVVYGAADKLFLLSINHEVFVYDLLTDQFSFNSSENDSPKAIELFSSQQNQVYIRDYLNNVYNIKVIKDSVVYQRVTAKPLTSKVECTFIHESYFYFQTTNDTLISLSPSDNSLKEIPLKGQKILGMSKNDKKSSLLCLTDGIYTVRDNLLVKLLSQDFSKKSHCVDLILDHKDGLWIAFYSDGIYHFKKNNLGEYVIDNHYSKENVFSTNRMNDLHLDAFNVLWVATSGGGVYHTDLGLKSFFQIDKQSGFNLPDNYISAIHQEGSKLFVGTRSGLVVIENYDSRNHTEQLLLAGNHITSILPDGGRWLIGTRNNGLFQKENDAFQPVDDIGSSQISNLMYDHLNRLWITTFDQGVHLFQNGNFENKLGAVLPNTTINTINIDKEKNTAWLGTTDKGLYEMSISDNKLPSIVNEFNTANGLNANTIWPVVNTKEGLWIGTLGGGLNFCEINDSTNSSFRYYTVDQGLPDNDIESMLLDDQGRIWLSGLGLTTFDPKGEKVLNVYSYLDGLQSNAFKINASFKNEDGRLFFGGINGLNYFDPLDIKQDTIPARIIFDKLSILNEPIEVREKIDERVLLSRNLDNTDELIFNAKENEFTISLLAMHHGNPDKNRYAYMLEGYNENWVEIDSEKRHITFANLKQGNYTLRAKAANRDGIWSEPRSLSIIVLPPWYLTWRALSSYFLVILILLVSYRYLIYKQLSLRKNLDDSEMENQKNEERLKLFTNISHEIRTPLTLIKGPLQDIIDNENVDSNRQGDLMIVNKNVDRLLRLTNQILDFRRYESGKVNLRAADGNIVKFVREVCALFRVEAARKQIQFNLKNAAEEIRLTYDRDKFEVVIANLISNALKFTDQGGKIELDLRPVGDAFKQATYTSNQLVDNYLQITVSDSGRGMSEEEVGKVFDRFYQAGSMERLEIQGTGIGLALVKNIVMQHKGEIELESQLNQGTKFTIKIPFGTEHFDSKDLIEEFQDSEVLKTYVSSSQELENLADTESESISDLQKPMILIVEDNPEVAAYIQKTLSKRYRTKIAKNGSLGLKMAANILPDLIISDVMMPEMDGIEMLSKVRENPDTSFIPLILLTARTSTLYELEGIETGAQDYITKPFNSKLLLGKVKSILLLRNQYRAQYLKNLKENASEGELPSAEYQFIENLRSIVLENLNNEEFSVTSLVKMVGMSRSAFYKRVKELTDRSAVQFIRDVRLKKARDLLKNQELNISQIAYSVGINDPKYFRQKFKELFGVNPKDFRESFHENEIN